MSSARSTGFAVHDVEWDEATINNFWDMMALNPRARESYFGYALGGYLVSYARRRLRLRGSRLLDYGCGPGHLLGHLQVQEQTVSYTGADPSPASVEALRERYGGGGMLEGGYSIGSMPAELAGTFDHVWCSEVVEHLSDEMLEVVLGELHRYVKPGGHVLVSTPHAEDLEAAMHGCPECGCRFHQWQHMRSWTVESLRSAMENAGFTTVSCEATVLAPWTTRVKLVLQRLLRGPARAPHLVYIGHR